MPEGDSVYRFAALLRDTLQGRPVLAASSHGPGPAPQVQRIVGATCTGVRSRGKNLLISFDNGLALRGHLHMYGTWHVYAPGEPWRLPQSAMRVAIEVPGAVAVNFNAPTIELIEERALAVHRPLAALGPDLLDDSFDAEAAVRRLRDPSRAGLTIGDAIMDQRALAGAGNIWKHETLFRCRVNPWRRVEDLDDTTLMAIILKAQELLRASVMKPSPGRPSARPTMYVYGRTGMPCRRCNTRLRSAPQGLDTRRTTWCPRCQPGESP
ncbi:MAG: Fpg/Nei family DNA glycosylase [Dehalococcoidia bacterium]|nr:Fpg/Nei family DNA glycosylase [Chloroflexi bacterium CFX7]MCK6564707.1 Fpg/Nei family DNA glycosylase [Dehalococcoidia bacterium]MCL4232408.1 Fpg/Nei family DNA glycosylase [Dehalococcoidia bacterium]NUQ56826.1 Fpg/Nei family DNA glycosylase [Dehalococcoidia bacterium]RIL04321.1 MAG: DNA lyase [bacterium]